MSDKSHDAEPDEGGRPGNDDAIVDPDTVTSDDEKIAELEETLAEDSSDEDTDSAPTGDEDAGGPKDKAVIKRKTAKAPVKKQAPTKKRDDHKRDEDDDPYRAKNPAHFVKQSASELKKVVWPTWPQLVAMFTAVLIFVLIMILIVGLLDFGLGSLLLWLLGGRS